MLGCQILVLNFILGGSKGYDEGMLMSILKTPPIWVCVRVHRAERSWLVSRVEVEESDWSGRRAERDPIRSHTMPFTPYDNRLACTVLTLVGRPVRPHDGPLQVV